MRNNTINDIVKRLQPVTESGCWIWEGWTRHDGYGSVSFNGKTSYIHLLMHEHFNGPIPDGYEVDHLCRVRLCANPGHLEAVTPSENSTRKYVDRNHCKYGHPLDVLIPRKDRPKPLRSCSTCRNARGARKAQAQADKEEK